MRKLKPGEWYYTPYFVSGFLAVPTVRSSVAADHRSRAGVIHEVIEESAYVQDRYFLVGLLATFSESEVLSRKLQVIRWMRVALRERAIEGRRSQDKGKTQTAMLDFTELVG